MHALLLLRPPLLSSQSLLLLLLVGLRLQRVLLQQEWVRVQGGEQVQLVVSPFLRQPSRLRLPLLPACVLRVNVTLSVTFSCFTTRPCPAR